LTAPADALGAARFRLTASGGGRERTRDFRVEVVRQKYRIMYLPGARAPSTPPCASSSRPTPTTSSCPS
jgi:hypothetical protein